MVVILAAALRSEGKEGPAASDVKVMNENRLYLPLGYFCWLHGFRDSRIRQCTSREIMDG